MDDCRRTAERLTRYVDGALPPAERGEVERHLEGCSGCRWHAGAEHGARTVLRSRAVLLRGAPLPPGLRTRWEAAARAGGSPRSGLLWSRRLVPVALVTLLIVFTGTALLSLATSRSDGLLAAQLTADHVKCFGVFVSPDAPSAEASMIERILAEAYGFDVHVPPSSEEAGLELVGARRCLYVDGHVPHLLYRVGGQDVSLFVLDGVVRQEATITALGHHSSIWSEGASTFVLVAPSGGDGLGAGELARVVGYVRRELQ